MDLSDILSIAVTIIIALAVQSWGFWKWLDAQFEARDARIEGARRDFERTATALRSEANQRSEAMRVEVARIDREIAGLRSEFRETLARMPTREETAQLLRERISPLENDMRSLVIELARLGVHNPSNGHRQP